MKKEALLTLRRATLAYISVVLICLVSLGQSLDLIILQGQMIEVPFAKVKVPFGGFLILTPIIVLAVWSYIQLIFKHAAKEGVKHLQSPIWVLGDMEGGMANSVAFLIHIGAIPVLSILFLFKARSYPQTHFLWLAVPFILLGMCYARYHISRPSLVTLLSKSHIAVWPALVLFCCAFSLMIYQGAANGRLFVSFPLNLSGGDFQNERFIERDFRYADFRDADMRKANLEGSLLDEVIFDGADLTGARMMRVSLEGASIQDAELKNVRLVKAILRGANFASSDLSGAHLEDVIAVEATFEGSNLEGAWFDGANLNGADLTNSNLEEAQLPRVKFRNATLTAANMRDAYLYKADLRDADLNRANLMQANLQNVQFIGANLKGTLLSGANLIGSDISQEQLDLACSDGDTLVPGGLKITICQ